MFGWADLLGLAVLCGVIYGVTVVAREWTGPLQPVAEIHLEAGYLPLYFLYSLARGVLAYLISFAFTLVYGLAAARITGADKVLLPLLDILQSIPVLGFLPGFVISLVHLFPHQNIGLEIASVLMIFTGQVWNMVFAFYASLKAIPPDLVAVAQLSKLTRWQRFLRLDLSFSASSLVWNSMMSMAGGWFFLTVSEAFVLGDHDFRLPGLGSYMSLAIERGDARAQVLGVIAMLAMIVLLDQLVWRPVVAWSQRFTEEEADARGPQQSWLWEMVRRSQLWNVLSKSAGLAGRLFHRPLQRTVAVGRQPLARVWARTGQTGRRVVLVVLLVGIAWAAERYVDLLHDLKAAEWAELLTRAGMTFLRVLAAVALASLWTIPVGVAIGRNPRWSRALQPLIQMVASFPAPMIYPLVVALALQCGLGLGLGSVVLLMLGTQWYILFNVISGSSAIPQELWEVARLGRFSRWARWRALILPGIFPSLLTGWITAMGGAWNASIVAEYMKYQGATLSTVGLGALISRATETGNFHQLAAAVGVMSLLVVGFNRLVWHPLGKTAQTRYSLTA
ncbi:ABC transporter permease [Verrucomicrobiota bacterium]|nr:ABC transporter permease [Verrucomicrobiota bacterium]